jgi:GNAT superfamily N-acetyltransferase
MSDMLVKLYDLPEIAAKTAALRAQGIVVRLAMPYEQSQTLAWVRERFGGGWADECAAAFDNRPRSCFVAVERGELVGFACHDATCRNFFGPMGVADSHRGKGIGTALFLSCLHAMAAAGYAYAIIGGAGNGDIYRKAVGAVDIAGSTPGIYRDRLNAPGKSS